MNTMLIKYTNPKALSDVEKPLEHRHTSKTGHAYTVEAIRIRVETVTPLLRDMLDSQSVDHWGIND